MVVALAAADTPGVSCLFQRASELTSRRYINEEMLARTFAGSLCGSTPSQRN
jgi:hypothetical protein